MIKKSSTPDENINLRLISLKLIYYWHYYLIGACLFSLAAYFYIHYSTPVYKVKASVIVKDRNNITEGKSILNDIDAFSAYRNVNNEVAILKSYRLLSKTLDHLPFGISYYKNGTFRNLEYFPDAPIIVKVDTTKLQILETPFEITLLDEDRFRLEIKSRELIPRKIRGKYTSNEVVKNYHYKAESSFEETMETPYLSFKISKNPAFYSSNKEGIDKIMFVIRDNEKLLNSYVQKLSIEPLKKDASVIELQSQGTVIAKEATFLNKLCELYVQQGLDEKNEIATNTIRFIDEQISFIADSLNQDENSLQTFRNEDQIMDFDFASRQHSSKIEQLEKQKADLLIKDRYYDYLHKYVIENTQLNKLIAPSAIGVNDPLMNDLINEISKIEREKASLSYSAGSKNPTYKMLELKSHNALKSLVENLQSVTASSKMALSEIQKQINDTKVKQNILPKAERKLNKIKRINTHNDFIFTYLMERRAAASIAKAANTADNKILDEAKVIGDAPLKPNKKFVFLLVVLLSFIIPSTLILFRKLFPKYDTIDQSEEVLKLTDTEIKSVIKGGKKKNQIVFLNDKNSLAKNEFIKLAFFTQQVLNPQHQKFINISSAYRNEGKSWVATNLAYALMLSEKKVLLIDANIYNPSVAKLFSQSPANGLTKYLQQQCFLDEVITPTTYPNLDFITPGEHSSSYFNHLNSDHFRNMLNDLYHRYDFIIMILPPISIYPEYMVLQPFGNLHFYNIKAHVSQKLTIENLEKYATQKQTYIVFNT